MTDRFNALILMPGSNGESDGWDHSVIKIMRPYLKMFKDGLIELIFYLLLMLIQRLYPA